MNEPANILPQFTDLNPAQATALIMQLMQNIAVKEGIGNSGPSPDAYRKSVSDWLFRVRPYAPYCAAFVNAMYQWAGINLKVKSGAAREYFSAQFGSFSPLAPAAHQPKFGDLVGFSFDNPQTKINHIGILFNWAPGFDYCYTIEANTSAISSLAIRTRNLERDGGGVYIKRRDKKLISQITPIKNLLC